jgi:hypothetical protein
MIIKKIFSFLFIFAFIVSLSSYIAPKAQAASFPSGCSSAIGYSITNGTPCNGTSNATSLIVGCTNVLGFSTITGVPCSGTSQSISSIEGCTSEFGYSITSGNTCNGTSFATFDITPVVYPVTPGLPTTGVASITPMGIALLSLLGLLSISGIVYATRRTKLAK